MDEKTAVCPKCKETVMATADICKHCRYDLLSYRKKNEQVALKKAIKAAFKDRLKQSRGKLSIIYSVLLLPAVAYLITAVVVLPMIQGKRNEDRVIAGVWGFLNVIEFSDIQIGQENSQDDPIFQYLTTYIDNGYYPDFGMLYPPFQDRKFMRIYETYKQFLSQNSKQVKTIETVIDYESAHVENVIKSNEFLADMESARANWQSGYKQATYKKMGSAINWVNINKNHLYVQMDSVIGYRKIMNDYFDWYRQKYIAKTPFDTMSTFLYIFRNDSKNEKDVSPTWKNYLFPSCWCFNFETVTGFPNISYTDVWIRTLVGILLISILFWPIALSIVFIGAKKRAAKELKQGADSVPVA